MRSAARWHLARFARAFRVSADDIFVAEVVQVQTVRGGTMTHLKQRIGGIDVHGSDVRVLARGPRLVAISGRPRALGAGPQAAFAVTAEAALATALSHRCSIAVPPSSVTPIAGDPASRARRFDLAAGAGLSLSEPAAVSPVFHPVGATLVAAYLVEFDAGTSE